MTASVWVRLSPRGLAHFITYCGALKRHGSEIPQKKLALHEKGGGWYEFSINEIAALFGAILGDGYEVPFEGNKIYLESPISAPVGRETTS